MSLPPRSTLFPYTTLFRSLVEKSFELSEASNSPVMLELRIRACHVQGSFKTKQNQAPRLSKRSLIEKDRKSTRLNSSHVSISYAVFCLKKKKTCEAVISSQ